MLNRKSLFLPALLLAVAGFVVGNASVGASPGGDPVKVDASHFKVIFENEKVRVVEFHSKPGDKIAMHTHPDHVIYALTDGKVRHTLPDGKTVEKDMKAGQAVWVGTTTHSSENIGKTDLNAILYELKPSPAMPAK